MSAEIVNRDIVHLMITMSRSLKLKLIAEGVESVSQLNLLRELGCQFGQESLLSQPVDEKQAEQLLRRQNMPSHASTAVET